MRRALLLAACLAACVIASEAHWACSPKMAGALWCSDTLRVVDVTPYPDTHTACCAACMQTYGCTKFTVQAGFCALYRGLSNCVVRPNSQFTYGGVIPSQWPWVWPWPITCTPGQNACTKCNWARTTCERCAAGWGPNSEGGCARCSQDHCAECVWSAVACTKCQNGYRRWRGMCI